MVGDVFGATFATGFTDEPVDLFAVLQQEGANTQRTWDAFDEVAETRHG